MSHPPFFNDTIAAISTPLGRGGIGIIRLSGPEAAAISQNLIRGSFPKPRVATYRDFLDAEGVLLDQGIILYFPHPNSFTGEDVVEFQGHGSPPILNALLRSVLLKGARLARPGEFSERAFLNNRLDLAQAEAIADLIHAASEQAARAAMRSLQGVFSQKVRQIEQSLIRLRTMVEAAIDFSEEAIELPAGHEVTKQMQDLLRDLQQLQQEAKQGQRLQEGMQLVIAGLPNAGKSSLLNGFSGQETAIVSSLLGTTRDLLTADIEIDGLPIHIVDTAGLHVTENIVEQEGIRRALVAVEKADQILWVVDSTLSERQTDPSQTLSFFSSSNIKVPIAVIRNKIDLSHESVGITTEGDYDVIRLSAATGAGLTQLKDYLKKRAGYESGSIGFSARARHIVALIDAEEILREGLTAFVHTADLEILAMHLTEAHQAVGEITGVFTTEDLLGHIFSTFCIGK
jgi:tRNA modification GTPase